MPPLLETRDLTKRFGGLTVLDHCSMIIEEETVVGLIGPNGAGKTTFFNTINGIYRPDAGDVYFKNKRINGLGVHKVSQIGIGRTFQLPTVFRGLTAMDNLMVGGLQSYKNIQALKGAVVDLLKFVGLNELKDELAGNLSVGQQKLLDLARALISNPVLLLLDEPFHGIHPSLKEKICTNIQAMNEEKGKTFLVVSHDIPSITSVCERIIVLSAGRIIADGPVDEIRKNKKVIETYLGV